MKNVFPPLNNYHCGPWKFDKRLFPHKPDLTADKIHEMLQLKGTDDGQGKRIEVALPPVHSRGFCFAIRLGATKDNSPDIFNINGYSRMTDLEAVNTPFKPELLEEALNYPEKMKREDKYSGFRTGELCRVEWKYEADSPCAWIVMTRGRPPAQRRPHREESAEKSGSLVNRVVKLKMTRGKLVDLRNGRRIVSQSATQAAVARAMALLLDRKPRPYPPETLEEWNNAIIYATADPLEEEELRVYMGSRWKFSRCICQNCHEPLTEMALGKCQGCDKPLNFDLRNIRSKPLPSKLRDALENQFPTASDLAP